MLEDLGKLTSTNLMRMAVRAPRTMATTDSWIYGIWVRGGGYLLDVHELRSAHIADQNEDDYEDLDGKLFLRHYDSARRLKVC